MFTATNKMSCRRGRCPGSEMKGSGYTKPADTALARENATAVESLLAARAAQDAKWTAAWTVASVASQLSSSGSSSTTTTPAQGSKSGAAS